jgi:cellulose synthase operon protein YhjQ
METHPLEDFEDHTEDQVSALPEDVAILYSWADLQGAKYRDFSANRREHRAQMRQRAAEQLRLTELRAQAASEAAANKAEADAESARVAAESAAAKLSASQAARTASSRSHAGAIDKPWEASGRSAEEDELARNASLRAVAQQARQAAANRAEAARRAEAAALATSIAQREQQEILDARASALRQAARYAEAGVRSGSAGEHPADIMELLPRKLNDPYSSQSLSQNRLEEASRPQTRALRGTETAFRSDGELAANHASENDAASKPLIDVLDARLEPMNRIVPASVLRSPGEFAPGLTSSVSESSTSSGDVTHAAAPSINHGMAVNHSVATLPEYEGPHVEVVQRIEQHAIAQREVLRVDLTSESAVESASLFEMTPHAMSELFEAEPVNVLEDSKRASISDSLTFGSNPPPAIELQDTVLDLRAKRVSASGAYSHADSEDVPGPAWLYPTNLSPFNEPHAKEESLEPSKDGVATRWFALRSLFAQRPAGSEPDQPIDHSETKQPPIVVVFSISGGSGKTSLVATLGRVLSYLGERVVLSDTTSQGPLPFYFGASQLLPGVVRTFTPPIGSTDAPIRVVSHDIVRGDHKAESYQHLVEDLLEKSQTSTRMLLDLSLSGTQMLPRLSRFNPSILVPLLPDMNSVISIQGLEKLFSAMRDAKGEPLQPVYLLNQFDTSQALHLDIREVLRQQLGERLLPFVIRRSPAVGEALAEGMTVFDYDQNSGIAEDYMRAANWLRSISESFSGEIRHQRWSER